MPLNSSAKDWTGHTIKDRMMHSAFFLNLQEMLTDSEYRKVKQRIAKRERTEAAQLAKEQK